MKANIFLTGFSGTGKTTVGRLVAQRLGWRFVDIDEEIVEKAGKPISSIFDEDGEPRFRELEQERLVAVSRGEQQVVSTGGGIVTDDANRRTMGANGVIVCLEARPDTIVRRLHSQQIGQPDADVRPMLEADDTSARIVSLKSQRQPGYALSHWTVHTDALSEEAVAEEVVRAWQALSGRQTDNWQNEEDLAATVRTVGGDYPVWIGWGLLDGLGETISGLMSPGAVYVISDEGVYRPARRAQVSLEKAGVPTHLFLVPPGEASKSLDTARHIYEWLAGRRAERGHLVLAVGGGVAGDLAGFVAATYLRGMPFGLVPTTVLAMMDAAIGGKTAVDLPQGKNLVGAFHQPSFVVGDVQTLEGLPKREFVSGWAEAIKHGLILDERLLASLEENTDAVLSLDPETTVDLVRRSVAIKAGVVSRDERETLGVRVLLNYGHTIGHAVEAATDYDRYLHGEAVSIGMMAAAFISNGLGILSEAEVDRQRAVLQGFGLPTSFEGVDLEAVKAATGVDKKISGGKLRWVLLDGIGHAVTRTDVPPSLVDEALRSVSG